MFAAHVADHPAAISLLDVVQHERHGEAAAEQQSEHGAITFCP